MRSNVRTIYHGDIIQRRRKSVNGITAKITAVKYTTLPHNKGMEIEERIKRLGALVRSTRKRRTWTLRDVATKTGLSSSYIGNIEKGYVNPKRGPVIPSDDALIALSDALGLPIADMHAALGRNEEIKYATDPRFQVVREAFEGGSESDREYLAETALRVRHSQDVARAGSIGRQSREVVTDE